MKITLKVQCALDIEVASECLCIAMLRPRSGEAQWLSSESYHFSPSVNPTEYVDQYGNLAQRFVAPAGPMQIRSVATVRADDSIDTAVNLPPTPVERLPDAVMQFLLPSRYCPADKMDNKAMEIAGQFIPGSAQVEAIRTWIFENIRYQYGQSDATTDALDSLAARVGVCRDFAHVGISLCRSLLIPARMVVGYLQNLEPMDLHAWFEAYIDGRWYTIDATQAGPRGGRVVLGYGRDAADVAFLTSYGLVSTTNLGIQVSAIGPEDDWTVTADSH